jgi:hypothetical protein
MAVYLQAVGRAEEERDGCMEHGMKKLCYVSYRKRASGVNGRN